MAGHHYLFMSTEAANLNANALWIAKNKREKALICPKSIDKTRFSDFLKPYLMFWAAGFSRGMMYLQLKPKNAKFYEIFELSFCVRKMGKAGFFRGEHGLGILLGLRRLLHDNELCSIPCGE